MNRMAQAALAVLGFMFVAMAARAETIVFQDRIYGYHVGRKYCQANPMVTNSQSDGSYLLVQTNWTPWVAAPGEEFIDIGSGAYNTYQTIAVTNDVTNRYGQVFFRLGKDYHSTSVKIALFSTNSPQCGPLSTRSANSAAEIEFMQTAYMRYSTPGVPGPNDHSEFDYRLGLFPTNTFFNLTINYDLTAAKYSFWIDSTLIASNLSLDAAFGTTVRAIAFGGSYNDSAAGAVMQEWYWKSDNTAAYTNYGTPLAPTSQQALENEWKATAARMVFEDPIRNYPIETQYTNANPRVFYSTYNGSGIIVKTNWGEWIAEPGNQFVDLQSGLAGNWTSVAVASNVTDRYGQVYVRVGCYPLNLASIRLIASSNDFPAMVSGWGVTPGAGADIWWTPGGLLYYTEPTISPAYLLYGNYPTNQHSVTINYDMQTHRYDLWVSTNLADRGVHFSDVNFGDTIRSIAVGGFYNSAPGNGAIMDEWYWRARNDQPFLNYAHQLPLVPVPVGSVMLFR